MKYLLVMIGSLFFSGLALAQSHPTVAALQLIVNEKATAAQDLGTKAGLQIALAVAVVILGGVVGIVQRWESKSWAKATTIVVGAIISIVTTLNNTVLKGDYGTLHRAALQVETDVDQMREDLSQLELLDQRLAHIPEGSLSRQAIVDNENTIVEDFNGRIKDIGGIRDKIFSRVEQWPQIQTVYAQTERPTWAQKLPTSSSAFYFFGEAEDQSLSEAKRKSMDIAVDQSVTVLSNQSQGKSATSLNDFAKKNAAVEDTSFTFDKDKRLYHYYTLLRLDKSFTTPAILSGVPNNFPRHLELASIRVLNAGVFRNTPWTFDFYVNQAPIATLPAKVYTGTSQLTPAQIPQISLPLPYGKDSMIKIRGHSPNVLPVEKELTLRWGQLAQTNSVSVEVRHSVNLGADYVFTFDVK